MIGDFILRFLLVVVISFSFAKSTKQLQAYVTCNGKLTFYDSQLKMLVVTTNPANISTNYTLNPGTEVLAMKCRTYKTKPWIMGSASNGLVTDTRWKCLSFKEDESKDEAMKVQWWATKRDFDDSYWTEAVANFSNREGSPWGKVPDISKDAFWISTAANDDVKLYCRRRMPEVLVKRARSNEIFQATLDDVDHALSSHPRSQHEVIDVMQCFKKCQDDSQCLSFNFEYSSVLPTKKCELNGVTKGQDPENYVTRPGYTYYEKTG